MHTQQNLKSEISGSLFSYVIGLPQQQSICCKLRTRCCHVPLISAVYEENKQAIFFAEARRHLVVMRTQGGSIACGLFPVVFSPDAATVVGGAASAPLLPAFCVPATTRSHVSPVGRGGLASTIVPAPLSPLRGTTGNQARLSRR